MPLVKRPSSVHEEMETSIPTKRPRTHQQNENQQNTKTMKSSDANCSHTAESIVCSQKNKGILVENTEGDIAAPKDVTALLTPPLEDNTTHPSNGTLAPRSPTQTPPSSPPTSPPSDPSPLSDRHGYRFRCSRCSLAFPTQEKLQLHWQYHAMRAATECPLCSRQCRSQEALQRHMQNTHSQQDSPQGQNALLAPHTVPYMEHNKDSVQQDFSLSPQVGQEAGECDDDKIDEETVGMEVREEQKEDKTKEKEVVHESNGVEENSAELEKGPPEEVVSEPSSSLLVKKSSNPTMDRYRDPSRPYKCTICSESFTQKTILLVHYNSVSHLHRARRALQDSGTNSVAPEAPRGPDPRPYRCRLCGVGYSQSSTLDIHLRSVLHQTRARAAQNSAPQNPESTLTLPGSVPSTTAQVATIREETSKSLPVTKKPDGISGSTSSFSDLGESQQAKKRVAELLASRNQLMLLQQQHLAQAQAQLQQQTALLQSQAICHLPLGPENLFKQHFSLAPDNLLSLQQQLLLPFYLSGDVKLNPELSVTNPDLGLEVSFKPIPEESTKTDSKMEPQSEEKHTQKQSSNSTVSQPTDHSQSEAKVEVVSSGSSNKQEKTETEQNNSIVKEETEEIHDEKESQKQEVSCSSFTHLGLECPPPRVPYAAANGEPLRALLQSYGYELALQYLQSRHRHQLQIIQPADISKDSPYNFNNPPTIALDDSREDIKKQCLTLSPCSLSPELSANPSPQPQMIEEPQRGRRSSRTRFTEQQLETLQGVFEATPYPREEEYDRLSALLSLPNRVIVVWFQNARQRARKNQDRGIDDGLEGKNHADNISKQRNGCYMTYDHQDNAYDDGQEDPHNDNSMDFTYEYYSHPDSPSLDSSIHCSESEHQTAKGDQTSAAKKREDKITSPQANVSPAPGNSQNTILDADMQQKEVSRILKTASDPSPESPAETPQNCAASSSQNSSTAILSKAKSDQGIAHSPSRDQPEKVADPSPSPSSAPESETIQSWTPDTTACLSTETPSQPQAPAQFQCSLCPVSLPSFQLWQEHQTRHLLAAQSQVQLLHCGFTDRPMPYMMLHPNPTLMASQMLSGAMSQIHPNPTHPMISHIQIKNTFSDHSSSTLNNSLTSTKQNTKHISETSFEGQTGNREVEEEHRRDKRQRTTITPEQLEVLCQRYSLDSNPTRGVLESIARDVGLTRRVVQNTRARERKGQFRSVGPGSSFTLGLNHLRCPFCRALFKVKSALDAHMRSRHWAEAERAGFNLSMGNGSSGQTVMAMTSATERPDTLSTCCQTNNLNTPKMQSHSGPKRNSLN
ncbi:hypothetical protein XENOCAPTIV_026307 [Xenoophorus captivus]|uniref:Uncharacterized protein n=1 Tax=Xenoophorus captivus TaxID=1517983 RepID=A0ABV0QN31_9TELE